PLAPTAPALPIAKTAANPPVGSRLDEIPNDITRATPASFEPTIDYVVAKIPKWAFEKFPGADPTLGTQMKSVGEAMSIGRTFKEALLKGVRSLETGRTLAAQKVDPDKLIHSLMTPVPERLAYIHHALCWGRTVEEIHEWTRIDPWFLHELREIVDLENALRGRELRALSASELREAKRCGMSDAMVAELLGAECAPADVRARRLELGIRPVFKRVD